MAYYQQQNARGYSILDLFTSCKLGVAGYHDLTSGGIRVISACESEWVISV